MPKIPNRIVAKGVRSGRPKTRDTKKRLHSTIKRDRGLGRKGAATRRRLMDAAERLLRVDSAFNLTVVQIAKEAKTSSATFYLYFDDVRDVLFALSASTAKDMKPLLEILEEAWRPKEIEAQAGRVVHAFYEFWNVHRSVLLYRNLEADRGDPAFDKLRAEGYYPLIEALATRILEACNAIARPSRGDARAMASVLYSALEHQAAIDPDTVQRTVGLVRLRAAQARIIAQVIRGTAEEFQPLPKV